MNAGTQALSLVFLGIVLVRLAVTDVYLRYVNGWMQWPVLASGVLLVVLGLVQFWAMYHRNLQDDGQDDGHGHSGVPRATWLLILPGVVAFVIAPPSLGAYVAERSANQQPLPAESASVYNPLPAGDPVSVAVSEFVWRARIDDGRTLVDRTVRMTGFVSGREGDAWYLTRLSIACCAADASAFRVRIDGADAPPRNDWVEITGSWVDGTGTGGKGTPALAAASVEQIEEPKRPYE